MGADGRAAYPVGKVHRLVEPGPTLLVSTLGPDGPNLMTNAWNMPVRHGGLIAFVLGPWDHSFAALRTMGECVLAVPDASLATRVVDVGNTSGAQVDKWQAHGFTPVPATVVAAPLVAECFATIECRVVDDELVDRYGLWIVEAVAAWVDERRRGAGEIHHRGDGTFSLNGAHLDLRDRMTAWPDVVAD